MVLTKLKELYEKVDRSKAKIILGTIIFVVATIFGNIISSAFTNLLRFRQSLPMTSLFGFHLVRFTWVYALCYLFGLIMFYYTWWRIRVNYESLEEGNKATGRFTTLDELVAQYKQVPLKGSSEETYEGLSGTIVARHKDRLFIDTDPAHNYTLGRSRSGKGQNKVIPDIDVYSRSEEKPHLVAASGKYELAVASYWELEKRGYEPWILNLIDMQRSLQYNCLDLVKQAYMEGDIDNAIELCKTFSYPLYHNEEAREPIWEETAMALVNAVILALCYEFIEKSEDVQETEKYVSMYAVSNMLVELGTPNEKGDTLLDKYFNNLPPGNPAKLEYSTVKYAEGQMRASIFATTQAKLRNFTAPKVAKMMSKSTFDFKRLTKDSTVMDKTNEIEIEGNVDTSIPGEYALTYSITNEFDDVISIERKITVIEEGTYQALPNHEKLTVTGRTTKQKNDYFKGIDHLHLPVGTKFNAREGIECHYFYRPQVIFLTLPDYIQTNYIIATTWISQAYHVLSDFASNSPGDRLKKRVRMVLDEFGNLPGLSNMASMLSVGAGRGILFDFYVQHPNQTKLKYGETVGEMINDEAMNKFYLLSGSQKAREDFSKILGNKEVTLKSRSGPLLDLNKQFTETVETRPLLMPDELGRLRPGEAVVERSIHRQDLKGNPVTPYPIFNRGKDGVLVYAYTYLKDQFDPDRFWKDLPLPTIPDIPLEQYSKAFVQRIKYPLDQADEEQRIMQQRKELETIMNKETAKLDDVYQGVEGHKVAADLNGIQQAYLPNERLTLIGKYGADHVYIIYQQMIKDNPEDVSLIDSLEYYDDYLDYLKKPHNEALYHKLQQLDYFNED